MTSDLERLRAERAAIGRNATRRFVVPGYKHLAVEYSLLGIDEIAALGDAISAVDGDLGEARMRSFNILMSAVIHSCRCFLYRDDEGMVIPLHEAADELAGEPIRWGDKRLAEAVGASIPDEPTAQEIMLAVIGSDAAAIEHARLVNAWMQGKLEEDDEAFLLDSEPTLVSA
jgi:hypothetical protein